MNFPITISISLTLKNIRCVKSTRDIKMGEIVEVCPVIPIRKEETKYIDLTVLDIYAFLWKNDGLAIALGYGTLYNHSPEPNLKFLFDYKNKTITFLALRTILKGEELFINYNQGTNDPIDKSHLSFDKEINE